ncbi:hypothetical protein BU17DRAFT_66129 [Hysterangium stoloniferum]|nr:hypothetical protein BU17DRAFT_66129 [Hysterangium stoloniferum]
MEHSNPGRRLSLNVAHPAGSEGVAHSVPGFDHTDRGIGSSLQPSLERPVLRLDEDAPPTAPMPVTVECSNPGPKLSLNVAHSAGSEGVAHSVPGYDHTDRGIGSSLQPSLERPVLRLDEDAPPTAPMPVTVECSNPGPKLSLNVAHSAGSEGVAHSVPGYDHTDRGIGSSLQPSLERPVLRLDEDAPPTAPMPVTVECSNPGPKLSLNVAHSAGSEGVAHSVPGYDHTDRGIGSSMQPTSEHPSDRTHKEDNHSYNRQNTDGLEENTLMDGKIRSTGSTMEILPLAIPESTGKEETASSQLPAPLPEASRPEDPANQETTRDSLADCVLSNSLSKGKRVIQEKKKYVQGRFHIRRPFSIRYLHEDDNHQATIAETLSDTASSEDILHPAEASSSEATTLKGNTEGFTVHGSDEQSLEIKKVLTEGPAYQNHATTLASGQMTPSEAEAAREILPKDCIDESSSWQATFAESSKCEPTDPLIELRNSTLQVPQISHLEPGASSQEVEELGGFLPGINGSVVILPEVTSPAELTVATNSLECVLEPGASTEIFVQDPSRTLVDRSTSETPSRLIKKIRVATARRVANVKTSRAMTVPLRAVSAPPGLPDSSASRPCSPAHPLCASPSVSPSHANANSSQSKGEPSRLPGHRLLMLAVEDAHNGPPARREPFKSRNESRKGSNGTQPFRTSGSSD